LSCERADATTTAHSYLEGLRPIPVTVLIQRHLKGCARRHHCLGIVWVLRVELVKPTQRHLSSSRGSTCKTVSSSPYKNSTSRCHKPPTPLLGYLAMRFRVHDSIDSMSDTMSDTDGDSSDSRDTDMEEYKDALDEEPIDSEHTVKAGSLVAPPSTSAALISAPASASLAPIQPMSASSFFTLSVPTVSRSSTDVSLTRTRPTPSLFGVFSNAAPSSSTSLLGPSVFHPPTTVSSLPFAPSVLTLSAAAPSFPDSSFAASSPSFAPSPGVLQTIVEAELPHPTLVPGPKVLDLTQQPGRHTHKRTLVIHGLQHGQDDEEEYRSKRKKREDRLESELKARPSSSRYPQAILRKQERTIQRLTTQRDGLLGATHEYAKQGEAQLSELSRDQEQLRAENVSLRAEMSSMTEVMQQQFEEALQKARATFQAQLAVGHSNDITLYCP
jgi:hypothetical protein